MRILGCTCFFALIACGPPPADGGGDAAVARDAGTQPVPDSGATQDSGVDPLDAGPTVADAGARPDASPTDMGAGSVDTGVRPLPDAGQSPALEPNICSIYRSQMFAGCANGYCHGAGQAGGFRLDHSSAQALHASLVDVESAARMYYVLPENVRMSYLINKLQGTQEQLVQGAGERMPPGGPYFDREQMDVLRRWIETGASDRCP